MGDGPLDGCPRMSSIEYALFIAKCRAEGHRDALLFAMHCRGDIDAIRVEIAEHLDLTQSGTGPWALGTSTRTYQDAYIAGLRYAIEIIEAHSRE